MAEKNQIAQSGTEIIDIFVKDIFGGEIPYKKEKQILCTYAFGYMNACAMEIGAEPVQVHGTMLQILHSKMGYSLEAAAEFSQYLIDSTDRSFNATMYAIIHRGLEGYYIHKEKGTDAVTKDFYEVFKIVTEG